MDESLAALAVIELPGRSVAAGAGQRGQVKHAPQPAVVAFRPVQIATDAAGISWYRDQSGVGRQPARGGEGGQVAAGNDHEFRAEAGSEAGQRLDDVRVAVITEAFGDGFVDVFDLVVEVEGSIEVRIRAAEAAGLPHTLWVTTVTSAEAMSVENLTAAAEKKFE